VPYLVLGCRFIIAFFIDKACFVCESDDVAQQTLYSGENMCSTCTPPARINRSNTQHLLEHIGSHILYDSKVTLKSEPCGFCLRPMDGSIQCRIYLKKPSGAKRVEQLDTDQSSGCPAMQKFSYAKARVSNKDHPCSNIPLVCPLCPGSEPCVWKYNLEAHFQRAHPQATLDSYFDANQRVLSASELAAMRIIWDKRHAYKPRQKRTAAETIMNISEAHSSRLALRSDIFPGQLCLYADSFCLSVEQPTLSLLRVVCTHQSRKLMFAHWMALMNHPFRTEKMPQRVQISPRIVTTGSAALNEELFSVTEQSSWTGRVRRTRAAAIEVSSCICGIRVTDDEITAWQTANTQKRHDNPSAATIMQCRYKGCESKWVM
jgi:hypothetical protein